MSRATLGKVELDRTNLASDLRLNGKLERLTGAGKLFVTESIGRLNTDSLANVSAVSKANALGNRDNYVGVIFECRANVSEDLPIADAVVSQPESRPIISTIVTALVV